MNHILYVSPSSLSFLIDECKGCFWQAVVARNPRPPTPFPSVFNILDRLEKQAVSRFRPDELRIAGLDKALPGGTLVEGELWVESKPFLSANGRDFALRGKMDMFFDFEDGTSGVIDFKTARPKPEYFGKYGRQLNAYKHAIEHPAGGDAESISRMGLVYFTPDSMEVSPQPILTEKFMQYNVVAACGFRMEWVEIDPFDVAAWPDLVAVLSAENCPEHDRLCGFKAHYRGLRPE